MTTSSASTSGSRTDRRERRAHGQKDTVDHGKYGESWDAAAALFRAATTRADWKRALEAARRPFGKVISRKVRGTEHRTSLPGAPDGEYVVVQFDTSFEKMKKAVETVTPMREADGSWKVSGYFVK